MQKRNTQASQGAKGEICEVSSTFTGMCTGKSIANKKTWTPISWMWLVQSLTSWHSFFTENNSSLLKTESLEHLLHKHGFCRCLRGIILFVVPLTKQGKTDRSLLVYYVVAHPRQHQHIVEKLDTGGGGRASPRVRSWPSLRSWSALLASREHKANPPPRCMCVLRICAFPPSCFLRYISTTSQLPYHFKVCIPHFIQRSDTYTQYATITHTKIRATSNEEKKRQQWPHVTMHHKMCSEVPNILL